MSLHDRPVPIRRLRVINPDTGLCWGYFHDDREGLRIARRIAEDFASAGAVVQRQEPPTVHPWTTIDLDERERNGEVA